MMPRLPIDEPLFQVDQLFRRTTSSHRAYDASSNGYVLWHWQDDQGIHLKHINRTETSSQLRSCSSQV